jgi:hypothetical protein
VDAGAGPAGHGRAARRAVGQFHVDLDGRISAAIENLSGTNVYNRRAHVSFSTLREHLQRFFRPPPGAAAQR